MNVAVLEALLRLKDEMSPGLKAATLELQQNGKKWQQVGGTLKSVGSKITLGLAIPILAAGAAVTTAAIDYDSSLAGVRKTVDATEPEIQALGRSFRGLAQEIPVSVVELNRIGEAAGQLGIKKENIVGFTRVMADLGVTTNLSSEQAATALARFANITGLPQDQFDRLGSTIVALGNNFATTEAEIVEMGLRLAGAGTQIGLTEGQILAMATALSSVGISAEAGGSAISKVMINIALAVSQGGDSLRGFASAAGLSAEQFARSFKQDAAGAVNAFITGLGRMQKSGGDVLGTLEQMGIKEVRMRDALLRAAGAGDLLTRALDLQAVAWSENTALADEARQRYDTFSSQLAVFWNRVKDVAITIGTALLPSFRDALDAAGPLVAVASGAAVAFANLPQPIRTATVAVGALVIVGGPLLILLGSLVSAAGSVQVGFAKMAASVAASRLVTTMATLGPEISGVSGALNLLASRVLPSFMTTMVQGRNAAGQFTGGVNILNKSVLTSPTSLVKGLAATAVSIGSKLVPALRTGLKFFLGPAGWAVGVALVALKFKPLRDLLVAVTGAVVAFVKKGLEIGINKLKEFANWIVPDGLVKWVGQIGKAAKGARDFVANGLNSATEGVRGFTANLALVSEQVEIGNAKLEDMASRGFEVGFRYKDVAGVMVQYSTGLMDTHRAQAAAAKTAKELVDNLAAETAAAEALKTALSGFTTETDALTQLQSLTLAATSGQVPVSQLRTKYAELLAKFEDMGVVTPAVTREMRTLTAAIDTQRTPLDRLNDRVNQYLGSVKLVPPEIGELERAADLVNPALEVIDTNLVNWKRSGVELVSPDGIPAVTEATKQMREEADAAAASLERTGGGIRGVLREIVSNIDGLLDAAEGVFGIKIPRLVRGLADAAEVALAGGEGSFARALGIAATAVGEFSATAQAALNAVSLFMQGKWVAGVMSAVTAVIGAIGSIFGGKTDAKQVAEKFGFNNLSEALLAEIDKTAEGTKDFDSAFRLHIGAVIREVGAQSEADLAKLTSQVLQLFTSFDLGHISAAQATDAMADGLAALIPLYDQLGVSVDVLTAPGGILSDLVSRVKQGQFSIEELTSVFATTLAGLNAIGQDGSAAFFALAEEVGVTRQQIEAMAQDMGLVVDVVQTAQEQWRQWAESVGVNFTLAKRHNRAYFEDLAATMGLSAETAAAFVDGQLANQRDARTSFLQDMRQSFREAAIDGGLVGDQIKEFTQANMKLFRQGERAAAKAARQARRQEVDDFRTVQQDMSRIGINEAAKVGSAWVDAANDTIAAWDNARRATVGGSSILDIARLGSAAADSLGQRQIAAAVATERQWSASGPAIAAAISRASSSSALGIGSLASPSSGFSASPLSAGVSAAPVPSPSTSSVSRGGGSDAKLDAILQELKRQGRELPGMLARETRHVAQTAGGRR